MDVIKIIGLSGAILAAVAYWPQIAHLIRQHCSAGISLKAYTLWLLSALAILTQAVATRDLVFICFGLVQTLATITILFFANKYKGLCSLHQNL